MSVEILCNICRHHVLLVFTCTQLCTDETSRMMENILMHCNSYYCFVLIFFFLTLHGYSFVTGHPRSIFNKEFVYKHVCVLYFLHL